MNTQTILLVACIVGYFFITALVYTTLRIEDPKEKEWTKNDMAGCSLFWPITLPLLIVCSVASIIFRSVDKLVNRLKAEIDLDKELEKELKKMVELEEKLEKKFQYNKND